jgi:hypothetical protein
VKLASEKAPLAENLLDCNILAERTAISKSATMNNEHEMMNGKD